MREKEYGLALQLINIALKKSKSVPSNLFTDVDWGRFKTIIFDEKITKIIKDTFIYLTELHPSEKLHLDELNMCICNFIQDDRNRMIELLAELKKVCDFSRNNDIKLVLIKGFTQSKMLYNDLFSRSFNDLDLLIEDDDTPKLFAYFEREGYVQRTQNMITQAWEEVPLSFLSWNSWFHEYHYRKHNDDNIRVEIKKTSSAIGYRHIDDFKLHTIETDIDDINIYTFDALHSFLHLLANAYHSCTTLYGGSNFLRNLVDVAVFIENHLETIDLQDLKDFIRKYELSSDFQFITGLITIVFGVSKNLELLLSYVIADENSMISEMLNKASNDITSYIFNNVFRNELTWQYWKSYFLLNSPCALLQHYHSGTPLKFKLTESAGEVHFDVFQNETHIIFVFNVNNCVEYTSDKYAVLHLVDFNSSDMFMHRMAINFNEQMTVNYEVEYEDTVVYSTISNDTLEGFIKIGKECFKKQISNQCIALNLTLKQIIKPGIEKSIWAISEVTNDGHNIETLPVYTFD